MNSDDGEESSAYSYGDFGLYQFSDEEEEDAKPNINCQAASTINCRDNEDNTDEDDLFDNEAVEWGNYSDDDVASNAGDNDSDSLVMHQDNNSVGNDFGVYEFSDVDDENDEENDKNEEWVVSQLLANRRDFTRLELILEAVDDLPRLLDAIRTNQYVRKVTIYEAFLTGGLTTPEARQSLAEAVSRLPRLEHLKVYYYSHYFVEPLERIRPPRLKRLCLMFYPERVTPTTLAHLTNVLKSPDPPPAAFLEIPTEHHSNSNSQQQQMPELVDTPPISLPLSALLMPQHPEEEEDTPPASLISMTLRCQIMDDDLIQAIAEGLQHNSTLTTLSFWGKQTFVTERGSAASAKIDFYLRLNQCGIRDMHLLVNATPEEFVEALAKEQTNLDHVFYLLSTNPSFLSYLR